MQILRIDSAVTGENSISRELTSAITDHFLAKHPEAELVVRDLVAEPLAHIDPVTTPAIRLPAEQHDAAQSAAHPAERAVLDEFFNSDIVIVGAPMYNFSIPSQLKAWIDRLGVPRVTFRYGENGPEGMAGGRRVIIASARGGSYEQGQPSEHQETLLRAFFNFIGIEAEFVRAEGAGRGPEAREAAMAKAQAEIAKL